MIGFQVRPCTSFLSQFISFSSNCMSSRRRRPSCLIRVAFADSILCAVEYNKILLPIRVDFRIHTTVSLMKSTHDVLQHIRKQVVLDPTTRRLDGDKVTNCFIGAIWKLKLLQLPLDSFVKRYQYSGPLLGQFVDKDFSPGLFYSTISSFSLVKAQSASSGIWPYKIYLIFSLFRVASIGPCSEDP